MHRTLWTLGSLLALLAVAAGAFGAHALRVRLPADLLAVWETAARYQVYHALALLAAARMAGVRPAEPAWRAAGWLWVAGTLLFSGSLYLLALSGIRWLGAVAPLGGLCFLAGWAAFAWAGWRTAGRPPEGTPGR